ncbi:hypothetical protein CEE44_01800 [Candidatus Woesearchaeota archaeon B3_Woes]|nr:MAG: hypothetical protein CEE44_01800 [Candidatus Woesearchaeota archaeon B3_Woes]
MKLIFLLIILIISGCVYDITGNVVKEIVEKPLVFFCPYDPCEDLLIGYINNSDKSVHCALFDIDLENVLKTLSEKSKEIDIKVVIDNTNFDKKMSGRGIIKDTSSQLTHNKFCVFDNKILWTGSFNPTNNGAYKNNNNVIIIESRNLANNYELEFNELWNYNFGKGHKTVEPIVYLNNKKYENYFCPEDNCKQHVLDILEKATQSIYFMIFSFTDFDIVELLALKKRAGLDVKGVLESKRTNMQYNQYNNLVMNGIIVKKDTNPYTMHHKVFIIDNKTVITGSYNPTKSANTKNDENILIIHNREIAQKYLEEFDSLFITS